MRFYKMTSMMQIAKILFSLSNKQFIILENKSITMGILLLKHLKFDQELIIFIKELLTKVFNSATNDNNNKYNEFVGISYANLMTFFDKTELYDLLGLKIDANIYANKLSVDEYGFSKKVKVIDRDLFKFSNINEKV